jgi:transcriptional regulator of acetoin/glycerol metabolism
MGLSVDCPFCLGSGEANNQEKSVDSASAAVSNSCLRRNDNDEDLINLSKTLNVSQMARALNVSRQTIHNRLKAARFRRYNG